MSTKAPLSPTQMLLMLDLDKLRRDDSRARHYMIDGRTVSASTMDALFDKGMIRTAHLAPGRKMTFAMTEQGAEALERTIAAYRESCAEALERTIAAYRKSYQAWRAKQGD